MKTRLIPTLCLLVLPEIALASVASIDEPGILSLVILGGAGIAAVKIIRRR